MSTAAMEPVGIVVPPDTSEINSEVTTAETEPREFQVGQRIKTKSFGAGTVEAVSGDVITVHFDDGQQRKMKADYLMEINEVAEAEIKVDEIGLPEPLIPQPTPDLLTHLDETSEAGIAYKVAGLEKELLDVIGQVVFFEQRRAEYRLKAGRLLIKLQGLIKEHEGYGTWEKRCRNTYNIDPRTANNYMRDARAFDAPPPPPPPVEPPSTTGDTNTTTTSGESTAPDETDTYAREVADRIAREKHEREEADAAAAANVKEISFRLALFDATEKERDDFKAACKRNPALFQELCRHVYDVMLNPPPVIRSGKTLPLLDDEGRETEIADAPPVVVHTGDSVTVVC